MGGVVSSQDDLYPLTDSFVWNNNEPFVFIVQERHRKYEANVKEVIKNPNNNKTTRILGWIPLFRGPNEYMLYVEHGHDTMNAIVFPASHRKYQLSVPLPSQTHENINAAELFYMENSLLWIPLPHLGFSHEWNSLQNPFKVGYELYRCPQMRVVFCSACNLVDENIQCIWMKEYSRGDSVVQNRVHAIGKQIPSFVRESMIGQIPRKIELPLTVNMGTLKTYGEALQIKSRIPSDPTKQKESLFEMTRAYFGCMKVWLEQKDDQVNLTTGNLTKATVVSSLGYLFRPEVIKNSSFRLNIKIYFSTETVLLVAFTKNFIVLVCSELCDTDVWLEWTTQLHNNDIGSKRVYITMNNIKPLKFVLLMAFAEKLILSNERLGNVSVENIQKEVGIDENQMVNHTREQKRKWINYVALFKFFIRELTKHEPLTTEHVHRISWPFSKKITTGKKRDSKSDNKENKRNRETETYDDPSIMEETIHLEDYTIG